MSDSLKTVCCPNILIHQVTVYIFSLFIILTQQIVISMHIKYFWWLYKIFLGFLCLRTKKIKKRVIVKSGEVLMLTWKWWLCWQISSVQLLLIINNKWYNGHKMHVWSLMFSALILRDCLDRNNFWVEHWFWLSMIDVKQRSDSIRAYKVSERVRHCLVQWRQ